MALIYILKFKIHSNVNNRVTVTSNLNGQTKKTMKTQILAEPVLVGRERELEELQAFLDLALEGKGKTVFVSGEAGSGKTRLAREFLSLAKKKGIAVMAGWCLSDAAVPYFPFVEAIHSYTDSFEEEPISLQQTEPDIGPGGAAQIRSEDLGISAWLTGPRPAGKPGKPEALSPQIWKDQAFDAVAKTLHSISTQEPIILFIEDIHWADSASLALLHYVARAITSERILVLATFRSEELTADAEGRPHPLADTLRAMRREDLFTEINLSNLNQANVSKIAENMIGGSLQPNLTEKLTVESRGNPLFVVESLRMLFERKNLVEENGEWRLAFGDLGIPSKVKDIILRRLAILKYAQRRVLDAASVIGEKFDVELLGTVLGLDSLEVVETLNVIAHSTSLVCVEESCYRFDHAKSRETLYDELSSPLKRAYHARIAEKLESTKSPTLPLSDLAYHYAQAGNREKAAEYALDAGEDALARWSNEEAIKHFTYILASVPENPENAETRRKAREGLGDAYYANSMFKEATRAFEDLGNSKTGVVRLRALRKAMEAVFQYGDMPHLMELVKNAEPYAAADRLENARVLMSRGRSVGMQGMLLAALEDWEAALRVFEEEYSLWDVAWALIAVGINHAQYAVTDCAAKQGLAESLRSIAMFEDLGDSRWQMEACYVAGVAFSNCRLDHEALEMLAKVVEIDEKMKMGDYFRLVHANTWSAWSFEAIGDFEKGLAFGLKALELSEKTDSPVAHGMVYSNLTVLYALLGDMKRSEEYFEKLMKLPPEILTNINIQPEFPRLVFFAVKNQWKESNQLFEETLEHMKRTSSPPPQAALKLKRLYAWALEKQGRFEEAKILREEVQRAYREAEERFAHASVQASLMVRREVTVGEKFEMRLDLVNVSRKPGLLVKAETVIPSDGFKVTALPPWCSLQNGGIVMKNREIAAFQVVTVKFTLQAVKNGIFTLNPKVVYLDDLGESRTWQHDPITVTVKPAQPTVHVLPGRVSSGFDELDDLLEGGIPEKYAIVLASPSSDERSLLIKRFLEAGAEAGETTFYITAEAGDGKALAEKYPSNFYLFICNPRADAITQSLPNVVKLKGVENLTEIDIALTKAFRTLNPAAVGRRRACIDIASDVLLQHHAVVTRKWLSGLLPDLKAKGFTTLAVIDPQMHPQEEVQAITGLFEGEIRILERETANRAEKVLRIRKLDNQKYVKNELILTTEKLGESK
jgi:KaiC/GvpD/RAD55 family RecA-like ATPase/tetratricopeptide (TPR) repeat protein